MITSDMGLPSDRILWRGLTVAWFYFAKTFRVVTTVQVHLSHGEEWNCSVLESLTSCLCDSWSACSWRMQWPGQSSRKSWQLLLCTPLFDKLIKQQQKLMWNPAKDVCQPGCWRYRSMAGVAVDFIPSPWNVFILSIVRILWSSAKLASSYSVLTAVQ